MWNGSCVYIHLVLSLAPFASNILAIAVWLSMVAKSTGVKSSSLVLCVCGWEGGGGEGGGGGKVQVV